MQEFRKILVARRSPKNRCAGPEGEWLVPATNRDKARVKTLPGQHYFVSLRERSPNLLGWVAELDEPITAEALQALDRRQLEKAVDSTVPLEIPEVS